MVTTVESRQALARPQAGQELAASTVTSGESGEVMRVVVLEAIPQRIERSHDDGAFEPLSEDAYFALPNSYLEYEWQ